MFARTQDEKKLEYLLQRIAAITTQVAYDDSISLDYRSKQLQMVYQKIPEVTKLIMKVKTSLISIPPEPPEGGAA